MTDPKPPRNPTKIARHPTLRFKLDELEDRPESQDDLFAPEETVESSFDDLLESQEVKAYLIVLSGPEADRMIRLRGKTIFGRGDQADLQLNDPALSRTHACVYEDQDGNWVVSDLGSQNGTFVNGEAIKSVELSDGDKVRLGQTTFKFTVSYPLE